VSHEKSQTVGVCAVKTGKTNGSRIAHRNWRCSM